VTLILETRVQLRGAGRQEDWRDAFGHVELAGDVPSSSVKEHHGVCALGDVARDFVEVSCIMSVSASGSAQAAPTPRAGQIAPNR